MPKDTNTIIINGVASYFIFNLEKLNEAEKSQKYFFESAWTITWIPYAVTIMLFSSRKSSFHMITMPPERP